MFTKNIFTKKDPIADLIKDINEADYNLKVEELKGKQHKIDANKNGEIDSDDFKILRGKKKVDEAGSPFDKDYKSQVPTKPGEKAGFDSKKVSTGTVYSRKPPKPETTKEEVEELGEGDELNMRHKFVFNKTAAGKAREVARNREELKSQMKRQRDMGGVTGPKGKLPEEVEIDEALNGDMHPDASKVLKHIKPEFHSVYKPHLKSGVYKGTYSDRAAVLGAAEKAGHAINEAVEEPTHVVSKELLSDHKRWMDSEGFDTHTVALPKSHPKHATHVGIVSKNSKESSYHEDGFARPMNESVESIDEAELSAAEVAKKEKMVKSMKKGMAGFKERYGKRWKDVMYATATARAKKSK
jgi:hypothetical protein